MSEHEPAERDELRERATKLAQGYLNYPQSVMLRDAIVALFDDLRVPQDAPAEGISLSAQLSQAAAWMRVWDECQRLGMDTYGAPSTSTGLDIVLDFIRGRAAPQEAREGEPHGVEARDALGVEKLMSELARIARLFRSASELGSAVLVPIAADIDNARATIKALAAARPAPETREPDGWIIEYRFPDSTAWNIEPGRVVYATEGDAAYRMEAVRIGFPKIAMRIRKVFFGAPAPAEATEASDESARCTCEWMSPEDGSVHARWPAVLDARCAVHSREEAESEAALPVREAAPFSDTAVARIIEDVEAHCGMGRGAWDMVAARDLVEGFAAVFGAYTSGVLLPTALHRREAAMPQGERVVVGGWFEEYRCGCISDTVRRKRDLLGYCPKHGDDSRGPQRDLRFVAASAERKREPLTPPYTPAEEVVGMLVVGIHGIRDHNLDEMEWAIDLAAKLEALIDARIRLARGGNAAE